MWRGLRACLVDLPRSPGILTSRNSPTKPRSSEFSPQLPKNDSVPRGYQ
jgi:hypothetical protein